MNRDIVAIPLNDHGIRMVSGGYSLTVEAGQVQLARFGSSAGLRFATLGESGLDALLHIHQRQIGPVDGRLGVVLTGGHEWATFALAFDIDPAQPGLFHWRFLVTPHAPPGRAASGAEPEPELTFDKGYQVTVYTQQAPMAAGVAYLYEEALLGSTLFYFQDLTSLNSYFAASHTAPMGGNFPIPLPHFEAGSGIVGYRDGRLGLELPGDGLAALPVGQSIVVSDGYLVLSPGRSADEPAMALCFLERLASVYGRIGRPETRLVDWKGLARRTLADLPDPRNWVQIGGRPFLRAYVNDDRPTAELISQLDVLTSLRDYAGRRTGRDRYVSGDGALRELEGRLEATLLHFYSQEAEAMFNQPLAERREADSWYFVTALVDLSRLARGGDREARRLLGASVERAIEVAHRYGYVFPIFFDPVGRGQPSYAPHHPPQEYDVAGAYAYLMMDLHEDTGETRYLHEAQAAVEALRGPGFDLSYELHATALAATACARLFRVTGEASYLALSYLPLANLLRHCWLWECSYGYATSYRTFFGLSPMTYAAVITPKEQYEAWQALVEYLRLVRGAVPAAIESLVAEFCRHTLNTMRYSFAPMLPSGSVAERPRIARHVGRTAPELYIPLEDMRDGWRQSGDIAQELYGAGMALTFAARAYEQVRPGLTVYSEFPLASWDARSFTLCGTPDYEVEVTVLGDVDQVTGGDGRDVELASTEQGLCFRARGGETYLA